MEYKSCSFFGHRNAELSASQIDKLKSLIEDLIVNKNTRLFLFGSNSKFDKLCHIVVTELQATYPFIKRIVYPCKSEGFILQSQKEKWEAIYSEILHERINLLCVEEAIEHENVYKAGRASYIERNYIMIDDSDFCVFYYDEDYKPSMQKYANKDTSQYQPNSGTALAYKYARLRKKQIINILEK